MVTIEQINAVIGKPVMAATVFVNEPRLMTFHKLVGQRVEYASGTCRGVIHIDSIVSIEPVAPKPVQTELEKEIRKLLTSEENSLLDELLLQCGHKTPEGINAGIALLVVESLKSRLFPLGYRTAWLA